MNSLSWLILLADYSDGISKAAGTILVGCGVIGAASIVMWFLNNDGNYIYSYQDMAETKAGRASNREVAKKFGLNALKIAAVALVVGTILPSKNAIYAIAASEIGEEALKSKTASKAMLALDAWLDKQIATEPKPEK